MPACTHGERVRREGESAKGPWVGYFCPLKRDNPAQCKPLFDSGASHSSNRPASQPAQPGNSEVVELLQQVVVTLGQIEAAIYNLRSAASPQPPREYVFGGQAKNAKSDEINVEDIPF